MAKNPDKVYMPGEYICDLTKNNSIGKGVYVDDGRILASIVGKLTLNDLKVSLISIMNK